MTFLAFSLVFIAAFTHATWNLVAKRVKSGIPFIFLINLFATLIYTPIALGVLGFQPGSINVLTLIAVIGSAVIHLVYFMTLQKGYQVGDLSLVYPLARGTGPFLSTLLAIALLAERPTIPALLGMLLIVGGVMVLTGNPFKITQSGSQGAIAYGLLTGMWIATYSIWDKYAVSQLRVSPILLNYGCNLFEMLLLAPFALSYRQLIGRDWQRYKREVLVVAVLSPISYILVLIAMVFTPLSYVAPIRELSILVGAVMGHRLLKEGDALRRLTGAGVMIIGILTLALN